jgi:hypothetical protein
VDTFVAVKTIEGHDAVEEKSYCKVQDRKYEDWQVEIGSFTERNTDDGYIFGWIRVLALLGPMSKRFKIE